MLRFIEVNTYAMNDANEYVKDNVLDINVLAIEVFEKLDDKFTRIRTTSGAVYVITHSTELEIRRVL